MAKAPGVELKETDLSTIVSGGSPTIGAIVIWSKKGPFEERTLVTSTKRFRELFGNEEPGMYGHYSALAALQQGPLYVVRTALAADNPLYAGAVFIDADASGYNEALSVGVSDPDSYSFGADDAMLILGANEGGWASDTGTAVKVIVQHSDTDSQVFTIYVYAPDSEGNYTQVEEWECSRVALKVDGYGKSMYVEDVVNGISDYIRVQDNTALDETARPKEQLTQLQFGAGDDGTAPTASDIASAWDTYFNNKLAVSVTLLIAGGYHEAVVANKLSEICGIRQDCVAILDTQNTTVPATAISDREALSLTDPSYCVMFYPWVKDTDETNDKLVELPPSGYVAGAIMRKNKNGNIWDAVFGIDNGVIPVEGLTVELDETNAELLAQSEINAIISKPGVGTVLWGGRTLQSYESARSWLNVRELLNNDEQVVVNYLEPFVGKNNTSFTRLQVKSGLDRYFQDLIGDAYYDVLVVCDDTNNTSQVIDAGELAVDIYVQPVRPINRIKFQVVITRTGVDLTELAAA